MISMEYNTINIIKYYGSMVNEVQIINCRVANNSMADYTYIHKIYSGRLVWQCTMFMALGLDYI